MIQVRVIWSNEALIDLEMIYDFHSEKSPPAAQRIIESLLEKSRQLESFPESGPKQEFIKDATHEYRYLVEGNYKIIYHHDLKSEMVHIVTIFDTRFNPEKLKV